MKREDLLLTPEEIIQELDKNPMSVETAIRMGAKAQLDKIIRMGGVIKAEKFGSWADDIYRIDEIDEIE